MRCFFFSPFYTTECPLPCHGLNRCSCSFWLLCSAKTFINNRNVSVDKWSYKNDHLSIWESGQKFQIRLCLPVAHITFETITLWRIGSCCSKWLWMLNCSPFNEKLALTLEHLEIKMNGQREKWVHNDIALYSLWSIIPWIPPLSPEVGIFIPTL